jgi:hypothetical protein
MVESQQQDLCNQYGAKFCPPMPGSRIGIARQTLELWPLNGMRITPHGGACGWYLWGGGEPSDADDFYQPVCVEHLVDYCPLAIPFLALPEGWRFLTDGKTMDVWFDAALITDIV